MKIKQVFAIDPQRIDDALNEFIQTLPGKGCEITKITYIADYKGYVFSAFVEYKG